MNGRRKRDLLSLFDLGSGAAIRALLTRALHLKAERSGEAQRRPLPLAGKTVGMIFEKASTRTRVSFEVATFELGGHAVYLSPQGTQIGRGEPLRDTARVLGAYCHAIVIRTYGQEVAEELARFAPVPVINGLTDLLHPTQVLADLMTLQELRGPEALRPGPGGLRLCWIGDGNNMAHSWLNAAALLGLDLIVAHPVGREPDANVVRRAQEVAAQTGGRIHLSHDPLAAAAERDVLSTDVWASMGEEPRSESERAHLQRRFQGFCIDEALLARAAPGAIVLHCLPAHRGEEITESVLEGPHSAVFRQAENRLHMAKALLEHLLQAD
jgi:ornithine carbamoyltransferase